MKATIINLVNEMLNGVDSVEVASYQLKKDMRELYIEVGSATITTWNDMYVISTSDCSKCDGSHVDCEEVEQTTKDTIEALEMAWSMR